MVSAATLIWISCRALLRLMFCVLCGFAITKADVFPPEAAAGAGQVILNITMPCLMFSKIVPAFTAQNISALGPLMIMALLYEAIGMALAYVVKQFFWVPHRFRYGILVAGGWGNAGDIPIAVIMSVTGAAPFRGENDQNLAVAYISVFIIVTMTTLFPFGGHRLVAWDFQGPDVEAEEIREAMRLKRKAFLRPLALLRENLCCRRYNAWNPAEAVEEMNVAMELVGHCHSQKNAAFTENSTAAGPTDGVASTMCSPPPTKISHRQRQNSLERTERLTAEEKSDADQVEAISFSSSACGAAQPERLPSPVQQSPRRRVLNDTVPFRTRRSMSLLNTEAVSKFLKALLTPPSITILASILIALVPKLKVLFVDVPGSYNDIPSAPDGQPPLAVILDSANFIGAAAVPLGLICLGSSLARLNWPKRGKGEWQQLPLGAIGWIAISKMVVMPVLGVLICQGLTNVGFIAKEDKILRFVCIFLSCQPTATIHIILTQVYSGTGSAEHLAPFVIPQYILMFISMIAVTAYTIQLLF